MTQSIKPTATKPPSIFTKEMAKVGWQVGCATLLIVFIAFFSGVFLDRSLGTGHILTIVFVIGAGPLAMFASYRLALRAMKKVEPVGQAKTPDGIEKEEKIGE